MILRRRILFLAGLTIWFGACLDMGGEGEEVDFVPKLPDRITGEASPELHSSCVRAPAIDGVHCKQENFSKSYYCSQLLVENGACVAANGLSQVPQPGAIIWCCAAPGAGQGGAGGLGGAGGSGGTSGQGGTLSSGGSSAAGGAGGMAGQGGAGGAGGQAGAGGVAGSGGVSSGGAGGAGGAAGGVGGAGGSSGCVDEVSPLTGPPEVFASFTEQSSKLGQLALDSTHLYVAVSESNEVRRVPLSGGATEIIGTSSSPVLGVAEHGSFIYFVDSAGNLTRVGKDGSGQSALGTLSGNPGGIVADDSYVYALIQVPGNLYRVSVSGGAPILTGTFPGLQPRGLIQVGAALIVGGNNLDRLYSMPVAGGASEEAFPLGNDRYPAQLGYEAGKIWVASYSTGEILAVDEACKTVSSVRTGLTSVFGVAVNATHVYWSSDASDKVWRLPR